MTPLRTQWASTLVFFVLIAALLIVGGALLVQATMHVDALSWLHHLRSIHSHMSEPVADFMYGGN